MHHLYDLARRWPRLTAGVWFALAISVASLRLLSAPLRMSPDRLPIPVLILILSGFIAGATIGHKIIPIRMRGLYQDFFRGIGVGLVAYHLALMALFLFLALQAIGEGRFSANEGELVEMLLLGAATAFLILGWVVSLIGGIAGVILHLLLRPGTRGRILAE